MNTNTYLIGSRNSSENSFQKFQEEKEESEADRRLSDLRNVMRSRSSSQGHAIEALIVSSFDEHQPYQTDDTEGRLQYISGFSGTVGDVVVNVNIFSLSNKKRVSFLR